MDLGEWLDWLSVRSSMIVEIVLQSSGFDRECDEQLCSFSEEASTSNFLDLTGMLEKQYFAWLLFYH